MTGKKTRIRAAMRLIEDYGSIDGGHHKAWVIDQIARALMDERYDKWVAQMEAYGDYDPGIPP